MPRYDRQWLPMRLTVHSALYNLAAWHLSTQFAFELHVAVEIDHEELVGSCFKRERERYIHRGSSVSDKSDPGILHLKPETRPKQFLNQTHYIHGSKRKTC
jgi:hypothetical protein